MRPFQHGQGGSDTCTYTHKVGHSTLRGSDSAGSCPGNPKSGNLFCFDPATRATGAIRILAPFSSSLPSSMFQWASGFDNGHPAMHLDAPARQAGQAIATAFQDTSLLTTFLTRKDGHFSHLTDIGRRQDQGTICTLEISDHITHICST